MRLRAKSGAQTNQFPGAQTNRFPGAQTTRVPYISCRNVLSYTDMNMYMYAYIYIYVHLRVCVCVCPTKEAPAVKASEYPNASRGLAIAHSLQLEKKQHGCGSKESGQTAGVGPWFYLPRSILGSRHMAALFFRTGAPQMASVVLWVPFQTTQKGCHTPNKERPIWVSEWSPQVDGFNGPRGRFPLSVVLR